MAELRFQQVASELTKKFEQDRGVACKAEQMSDFQSREYKQNTDVKHQELEHTLHDHISNEEERHVFELESMKERLKYDIAALDAKHAEKVENVESRLNL